MDERSEYGIRPLSGETEAEPIEKALQEARDLNSILMDESPVPMVVINPDTSIRYINKATEIFTGFSAKELLGTKPPFQFWPKELQSHYMEEMTKSDFKQSTTTQKLFCTKGGEDIWVEMTLRPIYKGGRISYILSTWINLTEEKRLRRELELYSRKLMKIQEEERKRIAQALHDDTAQSLAILSLGLDSLVRSKDTCTDKAQESLRHLKEDTNRAMQAIRRYSYELRPGMLDHLGLVAALEQLVEDASGAGTPEIDFEVRGNPMRLPVDTELALFRITQEALTNIRKHAEATMAEVRLFYRPHKIRLTIIDNGKGFNADSLNYLAIETGSLGLVGMRERAHLVDAELKIASKPGHGTEVTAELKI